MNLVLIGRGGHVGLPDSVVSVTVIKTAGAAAEPLSGACGLFRFECTGRKGGTLL